MVFLPRYFLCWVAVFFVWGQAAHAAVVNATWNAATDVPVTASSYTAAGDTVDLTLNFAPTTGTSLTVVNNTGLPFISGTFANLAQGQTVTLRYNGMGYNFVAHYYGGTGNDLVLVWARNQAYAWGSNASGQLGDGFTTNRPLAVAVQDTGVLAGRTILALSAGSDHSLALCSDGTVAAWGSNASGQLGDGTTTSRLTPGAVSTASGVSALYGKTVVAISAGYLSSMVLCSDGTVVTWGQNTYGMIGDNTLTQRSLPVAVNTASGVSALYGKTVVAIAAGAQHNVVLCSDGTLAAWGYGAFGQLGSNSTANSTVPVVVNAASGVSALHGKTVVGIAAGNHHCLALCSDGGLASWGLNSDGMLGDNTTTNRLVPVAVNAVSGTSAFYGRTAVAIAAASGHSLVLCADGTLVGWGQGGPGQMGDTSNLDRKAPVAVNAVSGVSALYGRTVVEITCGSDHCTARCADGAIISWGSNASGQLGNNNATGSKNVPALTSPATLATGESLTRLQGGASTTHTMALVAAPTMAPTVASLAATDISTTSVTLNGMVNANYATLSVSFDYGPTTAYGSNVAATPATVTGSSATAVSAGVTDLTPGGLYHFRVRGESSFGTFFSSDLTFTLPSNVVNLAGLTASSGTLSPAFSSGNTSYTLSVPEETASLTLTPTLVDTLVDTLNTVSVNGVVVTSGGASGPVSLSYGTTIIPIRVVAQDGVTTKTYTVTVTRPIPSIPGLLPAAYAAVSDVPVSTSGFTATGWTVNLSLNFAPPTGTNLTVVDNTGLAFIGGRFDNLAHGQQVSLTYNGSPYSFVANYYGGTGNDLVLMWAATRPVGWGNNTDGQLGDNSSLYSKKTVPAAMNTAGTLLAGRPVLALSAGYAFSFALCADGTLAAWGDNVSGQLGNGTTTDSSVPVAVTRTGTPLAGKTVVAVSGGTNFGLALCSDGTLASWGGNAKGQLGNSTTTSSSVPVAVTTAGTVLEGKSVVTVNSGFTHNVVLCSDGTLAAWGDNQRGQLGNGTTTSSNKPVAVTTAGTPLAGKTIAAISTGGYYTLVLCTDGTLVTWGLNNFGQLGTGNSANSTVPVAVAVAGTPLAGKTPVEVAAGGSHAMVLCSDGSLVTWGSGGSGQLGNGSMVNSNLPVAVNTSGVLAGKTVTALRPGSQFCLVQCSDGTLVSWGYGNDGCLGVGNFTSYPNPVQVSSTVLSAGEKFMSVFAGGQAWHVLGLVAVAAPTATTQAATTVTTTTAVLNGLVNANGPTSSVSFEYGLDTTYGSTVAATPATASGSSATAVSTALSGLLSNTTYHFRLSAKAGAISYSGADGTFTTLNGNLSALALSAGTLVPAFSPTVYSYSVAVGTDVASVALTPVLSDSNATLKVNGTAISSGSASSAIPLGYGDNTLKIVVTAADQLSTVTYTLVVTRAAPSPLTAVFASSSDVPLVSNGLTITGGKVVNLSLGHAPTPGTTLTVVNNTGLGFINGVFSNLVQGQVVNLAYNGATFPFVADYYGGTGNDLVLVWAGVRPVAWGINDDGALGTSGSGIRNTPTAVTVAGTPLAGRTVLRLASSAMFSLALCSDGTLAAWGRNQYGQLGNNTTTNSNAPMAVTTAGTPLAGKYVVAVSAGESHTLALCSDGTLASWGYNGNGQLGIGTTANSKVPVAVTTAGTPLAGKIVVAIGASSNQSFALCADGTLATWGLNPLYGNALTSPVAVMTAGTPLEGRTVASLSAGSYHTLALCTDGTLVAWGYNRYGQLGNGTTVDSNVPVVVNTAGSLLSGKTVTAVAAGAYHSLALCSDGTVAAWGFNMYGALGNGSTTQSSVPASVSGFGPLFNRRAVAVAGGNYHSMARCSDGTLFAWGRNDYGQLGSGSTSGPGAPYGVAQPVAVTSSPLAAGESYIMAVTGPGSEHSLGLVATLVPANTTTLAASSVGTTTVVLNGNVNANGAAATASFEYGLGTSYGKTAAATPAFITGGSATAVSATLTDLLPNTTYHFRVNGTSSGGISSGADMTFTTLNGNLSALALGAGALLSPVFSPGGYSYHADVGAAVSSIVFTPTLSDSLASVTVNGAATVSGSASSPVPLAYGDNAVQVVVTAAGSLSTATYTVVVTRAVPAGWAVAYGSGNDVPASFDGFTATGGAVNFSLNYAPVPGASLMVVNNTSTNFINGRFSNLAHGQAVNLDYNGRTYPFVANYHGGTGNDLVLTWGMSRPVAWGWGDYGQLGSGLHVHVVSPLPVTTEGTPLAGRTVLALAAGTFHSVAVCSDGSLLSWGGNYAGALGNNTTADSSVPGAVTMDGTALAGKVVIAASAGSSHSLVLCSDGMLAAWGYNNEGELGNNSTNFSKVPVAVTTAGTPLAGRSVVAIGSGTFHSLALCSDGTLAAWGDNRDGELGANTTANSSLLPVAVATAGTPLAGRKVVSMAVGSDHNLALCSDGTLVSWGKNERGQLGNDSYTLSRAPVAVTTAGTPLAGKKVIAVAAGGTHSLALCSDGTLVAWGSNDGGQLGNSDVSFTSSRVPVAVDMSGVLAGKTIVQLKAGAGNSMVRCSDGTVSAWGYNTYGQLGNGTLGYGGASGTNHPTSMNASPLAPAENWVLMTSGATSSHALGVVALPVSAVTTLPATLIGVTSAVVNGTVNANGGVTPVSFEYGLDSSYGMTVDATPASVTGSGAVAVSAALTGLLPGTTYHFRVKGAGTTIDSLGEDRTFTTVNGNLTGLLLSVGALSPSFHSAVHSYQVFVSTATSSIALTPTASDSQATVTVNGAVVASGSTSSPVSLFDNETTIKVVVTAADGLSAVTYDVIVTRVVPIECAFAAATDVPITVSTYSATGNIVNLALSYPPTPGTVLTVMNNTGLAFINGRFVNLAHGQRVNLTYNGVSYAFVANYYGGTGNDLVLTWAGTRLAGWGYNYPNVFPANRRDMLAGIPMAGRIPLAITTGQSHILVAFSDGSLASWGYNDVGQVGDGTTSYRPTPVELPTAGTVLAGKVVVAVAAGWAHSLVLCSDGTLAAWGYNEYGQLGNGTTTLSSVPMAVATAGTPLEGRTVVAIQAAGSSNLVLCSDGTLVAWGANSAGQLGIPGAYLDFRSRPVAIATAGTALAGRTVAAISAGATHNLVLCTDGTVVAWGDNAWGQLGIDPATIGLSSVPVAVTTVGTALAGKTVTTIAAGGSHNLVLCSDGTLAAWGSSSSGALGNNGEIINSNQIIYLHLPVAVVMSGTLAGKTVVGVTAGRGHSAAWCADGTAASWGDGVALSYSGLWGSSSVPVPIDTPALASGEVFQRLISNSNVFHTLGIVATTPPDGSPPSSDATLSSLGLSAGELDRPLDHAYPFHNVLLDDTVSSIALTPAVSRPYGIITVNGQTVPSGTASPGIPLAPGLGGNAISIVVTAPDGITQATYTVRAYRLTKRDQWQWELNIWRNEHNLFFDSGSMANTGDIDSDGISNLMEYALNLNPRTPGRLPAVLAVNGGNFEYTYTRSTTAVNAGTAFSVQWSASLGAASWSTNGVTETVLSDDGTTQQVKAVIPKGAATSLFVRLSVGGPPP